MSRLAVTTLPILLAALVACSDAGQPGTPGAGAPRSAPAVLLVGFDQPAELADRFTVTMSAPKVGSDIHGSWLAVRILAENRGNLSAGPPFIGIRCAGQSRRGGHITRTTDPANLAPSDIALRPHTGIKGSLLLLLPGDDQRGAAAPACREPAFIESENLSAGVPSRARIPLPADLVASLNLHRRS